MPSLNSTRRLTTIIAAGAALSLLVMAAQLSSREPDRLTAEPTANGESVSLSDGLIAHWSFEGDCEDRSRRGNYGRPHGVNFFAAGRHGNPSTAARFDGVDDCIEIRHDESLDFGTGDFSIAAWVQLDEDLQDVLGNFVSKFDECARKGFNLHLKSSSGS